MNIKTAVLGAAIVLTGMLFGILVPAVVQAPTRKPASPPSVAAVQTVTPGRGVTSAHSWYS